MKISIFTFLLSILLFQSGFTQNIISGMVNDPRGNPGEGANVYLSGTYDGTTTGIDGSFEFSTQSSERMVLVVSYLSFLEFKKEGKPEEFKNLKITLKEDLSTLDAVVIT